MKQSVSKKDLDNAVAAELSFFVVLSLLDLRLGLEGNHHWEEWFTFGWGWVDATSATGLDVGSFQPLALMSILFGSAFVLLGYGIDLRRKNRRFPTALYLVGLLALWGGQTADLLRGGSQVTSLVVYGVLILLGLGLRSTVFLVFAGGGLFIRAAVFANNVFYVFQPVALGLAILPLALVWLAPKLYPAIDAFVARLPQGVRPWFPGTRR